MRSSKKAVIQGVELLLTERRMLNASGPSFRIVHRFRQVGSVCTPGEEIAAVHLVYRGRLFWVRIPLALRILFDYLAKHGCLPQSAAQIVAGIHADPFYVRHGDNALRGKALHRKITRSSIKEYVKRIRRALCLCFGEAGLTIDPKAVLVSEETVGNEVSYRLRARCGWQHLAAFALGRFAKDGLPTLVIYDDED